MMQTKFKQDNRNAWGVCLSPKHRGPFLGWEVNKQCLFPTAAIAPADALYPKSHTQIHSNFRQNWYVLFKLIYTSINQLWLRVVKGCSPISGHALGLPGSLMGWKGGWCFLKLFKLVKLLKYMENQKCSKP